MSDELSYNLARLVEALNDSMDYNIPSSLGENSTQAEMIAVINSLIKIQDTQKVDLSILDDTDDSYSDVVELDGEHIPHGAELAPDIDRIGEQEYQVVPNEIEYGTPVSAYPNGTPTATLTIYWTDSYGTKRTVNGENVEYIIRLTPDESNLDGVSWTDETVLCWLPSGEQDDAADGSLLSPMSIGTNDNPASILPASFEGADAAQADTWDRASQEANEDGVDVKITTRVVYDESGDETLHGFYRTFSYDSSGKLVTISDETEYTIDAPDAC